MNVGMKNNHSPNRPFTPVAHRDIVELEVELIVGHFIPGVPVHIDLTRFGTGTLVSITNHLFEPNRFHLG